MNKERRPAVCKDCPTFPECGGSNAEDCERQDKNDRKAWQNGRPADWGNPYPNETTDVQGFLDGKINLNDYFVFEAGASAMLEVLIKEIENIASMSEDSHVIYKLVNTLKKMEVKDEMDTL